MQDSRVGLYRLTAELISNGAGAEEEYDAVTNASRVISCSPAKAPIVLNRCRPTCRRQSDAAETNAAGRIKRSSDTSALPLARVSGMTKLPSIEDKALAAVNGEWRTAREIFAIIDEGAFISTRTALARLANAGLIDRRKEPRQHWEIARYRIGAAPAAHHTGSRA